MKNIGLKEKAKVIDLTRKMGTVETLTEARINCSKEQKVGELTFYLKFLNFWMPENFAVYNLKFKLSDQTIR